MVPFRLTQQQFALRYTQCLERLAPRAISSLRTHLSQPVQEGVTHVDVKIFLAEDDPHTPSIWIYYQGPDNRVDSNDPSLFPGRSLELPVGLEAIEEFDSRFFTNEKFGGLGITANVLMRWFAEMWWKAGGWNYKPSVTLHVHDGHGDAKPLELTEAA
jgi:hypothetical protein